MASEQKVKEIKSKHSTWLLEQPGVCGVGIEKDSSGEFVLAIHLDASHSNAGATLPDSIEGVAVRRITSGPFLKQSHQ